MPDAVLAEASRSFLDVGIVGAICIVLMSVIAWGVRAYRADMKAERDAHDKTREKVEDLVDKFATVAEGIRAQQKALEIAITTRLDRDR